MSAPVNLCVTNLDSKEKLTFSLQQKEKIKKSVTIVQDHCPITLPQLKLTLIRGFNDLTVELRKLSSSVMSEGPSTSSGGGHHGRQLHGRNKKMYGSSV